MFGFLLKTGIKENGNRKTKANPFENSCQCEVVTQLQVQCETRVRGRITGRFKFNRIGKGCRTCSVIGVQL